ncbi:MAG: YceI family protein [Acidimicrobiales bacterium]
MNPNRPGARNRRPLVVVAVLAVLAVAGLAVVYLSFFNDDAPERLALSDEPASGAGGTAAAGLAGTWRVAPGSTAGYRVREKLAALAAKSDAVGRSPAVTGSVTIEGAGAAHTAAEARVEVDLTQLESDESRRDNRIRSDGLQTNQFPKATFVTTKPITLPAETAGGQKVKTTAEGNLTLHGVTKLVQIPLDVQVGDGRGEIVGSLGFPMSDFDITPPSIGGFVTVDPDATLEFRLILEKA